MRMHFINYEKTENTNKYKVSDIINTILVSWYILWKCMKYNEYGKAYALYLLLWYHTEGIYNHLSLATIISNNPFWQRKCKCSGVSNMNVSVAMVTSAMVIFYCTSVHMILSSENKHLYNIGARLSFVDLSSIFQRACI